MAKHSTLTGTDLHEPKGVAAVAETDKAYISDGSASGSWKSVAVAADGASGEIFSADGSGGGSWGDPSAKTHAAAKITANTTELTPSGAGAFAKWVAGWTSIEDSGITHSAGTWTTTEDGDYEVKGHITFQGRGTGSNVYAVDVAVDGTPVGQQSRTTISSTSDVRAVPIFAYLPTISATQTIEIHVANITDTDNVLVIYGAISITKEHE